MFRDTMAIIREIRGLKCPNHTHLRDGHHFAYESIGGMAPNSGTRCVRCGYTKALHKPQR